MRLFDREIERLEDGENYQLPITNYQLSSINCQLSTIQKIWPVLNIGVNKFVQLYLQGLVASRT
ncbi:MAG: hypothetical protein HC849_09625, partial [Oscillatoriales cyanobacterium RU_3_3]|nr:hypothetical protein [Oscillatoriales cyanobacterium RU_3_3]